MFHSLRGLQECLGFIIPELILKVAQPQVLFAGGEGKSIFAVSENPSTFFYRRSIRLLIFLCS